jgi:hypothetical protein
VALGLGIAALAGCQAKVPPAAVSPVNTTPLIVDEAMQKRDWERSTSYYPSGAAVAGGTGYVWQTHETIPGDWRRVTDVPIAVLNIVCLPVGLLIESPFGKEMYHGEGVPPTYTAQPPLP